MLNETASMLTESLNFGQLYDRDYKAVSSKTERLEQLYHQLTIALSDMRTEQNRTIETTVQSQITHAVKEAATAAIEASFTKLVLVEQTEKSEAELKALRDIVLKLEQHYNEQQERQLSHEANLQALSSELGDLKRSTSPSVLVANSTNPEAISPEQTSQETVVPSLSVPISWPDVRQLMLYVLAIVGGLSVVIASLGWIRPLLAP